MTNPKFYHLAELILDSEPRFRVIVANKELQDIVEAFPGFSQVFHDSSRDISLYCFVSKLYDPEIVWLELDYALEKASASITMWENGIPELDDPR